MCFSNRIYQISFERESNLSSMLFLCLYTHALRHIGPYSLYIYIYINIYINWLGEEEHEQYALSISYYLFLYLLFLPHLSPHCLSPVTAIISGSSQLIGSLSLWHCSEFSNLCFSELLFCECRSKIDCLTFQWVFSTGIQNIPSFISTTNCSSASRVCCLINTLQPTAQHNITINILQLHVSLSRSLALSVILHHQQPWVKAFTVNKMALAKAL